MGAVFDVVARQNLLHQPPQLLVGGLPAGLDGRFAGDRVQQLVPKAIGVERPAGKQLPGQLLQQRLRILRVHVGRDLPDEHVAAAEILGLKAAALQKRPVFQHRRRFLPRKLRGDGREQQLGHDGVVFLFERLKADALMRGMLVNEQNGFALLTEERRATGIFGVLNIRDNTVISSLDRHLKGGMFLSEKSQREDTQRYIDAMHTKTPSQETKIRSLSGGNQQKVVIAKLLCRDPEILIFDEPTAVLTPQEISELMKVMKQLIAEGKSIIFITHKLNEIKEVANRCSVLRKGKYIGTVEVAETSKEQMSEMMVGRKVNFIVDKPEMTPGEPVLEVKNLTVKSRHHGKAAVDNVSFQVRKGEILCVAGIDGNGQSELVYGITGLIPIEHGQVILNGKDITKESIRQKCLDGVAHIPEDRHKDGLVLDYTLQENLVLQSYYTRRFQNHGFLKFDAIRQYAKMLIEKFDIRSSQGEKSIARGMSGGNQQKAIIARELDRNPEIVIAVQPVRGLDVGAIEYIHKQLVAQRDAGKAVLLVSLELDEVMDVPDRILVMYEGEIVGELDPKKTTQEELGLYMAGAKRDEVKA